MLKKIIKILITLVFIIWVGLVTVRLISLPGLINKSISTLQEEISILQRQYDESFQNDIQLLTKLQDLTRSDKIFNNYIENKLNRIDSQLKEVDYNHILRGNVLVTSFFGSGAGTVVKKTDKEMYVLTCYHVVEEIIELNKLGLKINAVVGYTLTNEGYIKNLNSFVSFSAEVIKHDKNTDLALLKVNFSDPNLDEIKLATQEPQKGDIIYSVGSPLGLLRTVSKGILANKTEGFYYADNTTTYGNSGGGLYNKNGELIGVPSNVTGYGGGLDKNQEETFIPESGLGLSRDLQTITKFLNGAF